MKKVKVKVSELGCGFKLIPESQKEIELLVAWHKEQFGAILLSTKPTNRFLEFNATYH